MISISGIRGTIPDGLDPVNIVHFSRAFAAVTGKRIVIGNDARPTAPILRHLLIGTLLGCGKEIIDIGLAPTPTVKAAVALWKAHAGVMISASHNPLNWNAFKFITKGGFFFDKNLSAEFLKAVERGINPAVDYKKMGSYRIEEGVKQHIKSVLSIIPNLDEIRKRKYRVVVDAVSGAGRDALPLLLAEMGCQVIKLYCDESRDFPRPPEPTPLALKDFGKRVQKEKAAAGFALDPDADRLVTGTPSKGAINEEYTIPLSFMGLTNINQRSPIIVNLSTTRLIDYVASKRNMNVLRSAVGEANVVEMMKSTKACFGGEGNGGVIHPGVPSFGRDSLTGAALILSAMAARHARTLDELMNEIPELHLAKLKFEKKRPLEEIGYELEKKFPGAAIDRRDGIHISLPDFWLHIRASNTEPIIRLIAEANSQSKLREILALSKKLM